MSINAAIVGVSGYGRVHYAFLREQARAGRLSIAGATIINPDEEAEIVDELVGMGCRIFSDYGEMRTVLRDQIDICCLPVPIHLHAPMTCQALEAGWNVLVEKPLAPTVQEVREIQAAERSSGRFVAVGFQEVYSPYAQALKRILLSGEIGAVRSMKGRGLWPRPFSYYARNNWAGRLKLGDRWVLDSPLENALSHYLHLLLFLAGGDARTTAAPLTVQGELYRAQAIESFDTGCIRIETDSGIPVLFHATHSTRETIDPEIVIEADNGRVEWSVHGECRVYRNDSDKPHQVTPPVGDQRSAMASAVLDRVTDPEAFVCTTDSAFCHTVSINGLYESSAIHPVPGELLETIDDAGEKRTVIEGIESAIDRAFQANQLLSESGVSWARPGRVVDVRGYDAFPSAELSRTLGG